MSSNITFIISNPAAKKNSASNTASFLYRGEDNQLDFIFTNNGLGNLPFVNGNTITIDIPTDVLESANKDQLIGGTDWILQNDPSTTGSSGFFSFVLTPKKGKTITFANNGSITIAFQKMEGGSANNDMVNCSYNVGGSVPAGKGQTLFVFNPPISGNKNITTDLLRPSIYINKQQQEINNGTVYISPANGEVLSPPIANKLHFNLTFSGDELVESWKSTKVPSFIFTFSYADISLDEALTNAIKAGKPGYNPLTSAWNINKSDKNEGKKVSVGNSSLWTPQSLNNNTTTPSWEVIPTTTNLQLFNSKHRTLDVYFQHVISVLNAKNVTAFIQWTNIPGYNDGVQVLNIQKALPQPAKYIWNFYGPDKQTTASVKYGTPVCLSWNSFGAAQVQLIDTGDNNKVIYTAKVPANSQTEPQLYYCGGIGPKSTSPDGSCNDISVFELIPNKDVNHYVLQALDAEGNTLGGQTSGVTINVTDLPKPVISKFDVSIQQNAEGSFVALSWETQGADKGVIIAGNQTINLNNLDNGYLPRDINGVQPYESAYTLQVTNANNISNSLTRTLTLQKVKDVEILPSGDEPPQVAVSPNGQTVWVTSGRGNSVSCFSATNPPDTVSGSIDVGSQSLGVAVNPDGSTVYVTLNGGKLGFFSATKPPAKLTPEQIISFKGTGILASGVAVSGNGQWLYLTNIINRGIYYMSAVKPAQPKPLNISFQGMNLITSPDGEQILINSESDYLLAFSANDPTNVTTQKIDTNGAVGNLAINLLSEQVWIQSGTGKGSFVRFTLETTQTFTILNDIGVYFWSFVFTPNGLRLFGSYSNANKVGVFDLVYI